MLIQIHIRDLATIEELQLNLQSNTTMITGETGAGKSIFIEAIELALGARASQNLIRPGKEKAEISLCFDITKFPHVISYLKKIDLYHDIPECIIRRIITSDGRSRCYVNGSPSTLQLVKELGELLFHLHGQFEQQILLQNDTQRDMLDRFADHLPLVAEVKRTAEAWKTHEQQIQQLRKKSLERVERSEYLQFQLEELTQIQLRDGEWEALEKEHHRLSHAEELIKTIQHATQQFTQDEHQSVLSTLTDIRKTLESIRVVEAKANSWINLLDSILIQLNDLESDLQNYLDNMDIDPAKLQEIEERVSQIYNLARKHKMSPQDLTSFKDKLVAELNSLHSCSDDLINLEQQQKIIQAEYQQFANQLSVSRKKAAKKLQKEITDTIRSLSLPHGEFAIEFETESAALNIHGNEKILFLIKTNPDQSLQTLSKVISGGELSRLSLAAHLALAHRTSIPTLVFDEVDTGLSGATAEKIGKLLRQLGNSYQVFCISHQPQVAAYGHQHLLVEKYFIDRITYSRLRLLNANERKQEIARMLGGEKITQKTLAHAEEILASF